jgi:hypothetical protein
LLLDKIVSCASHEADDVSLVCLNFFMVLCVCFK